MEVRYFDILSFLRRNISASPNRLECFVSAFVLNTLYDYQLRNNRIFSYVWVDFNYNIINLHDVQKWIELYCVSRENNFVSPELRICIIMIKSVNSICCVD